MANRPFAKASWGEVSQLALAMIEPLERFLKPMMGKNGHNQKRKE
jgi:hypothetical protein